MCNKTMLLLLSIVLMSAAFEVQSATLKIATVAPDGTTWMNEMRKGADEIKNRTNGRVKFKFYPGGVMGNDKSIFRKMRIGQLHGGAFTVGSLAEIYPDVQIYSLPFLFRSYEEVDYVRTHMDDLIRDGLRKHGLTAVGMSEGGFAYAMSNSRLQSFDDVKGHKVWIPEGDTISQEMFEAVGVSPIPLPIADVYTGLQTGLIDTVSNTAMGAIAFQWHTRVESVMEVPLIFLFGALVIDNKAFNKLTPSDQAIMQEEMAKVFERLDQMNRIDNDNARQALIEQGIEFHKPAEEELAKWQPIFRSALVALGKKGAYTPQMLETLEMHLANYRHQQLTQHDR